MPEYTPDRAEVDVLAAEIRVMAARYPELNTARGVALDILGSRWLAARDRENRAIGWDEGYEAGRDDDAMAARGLPSDPGYDDCPHDNPYRENR